ncbi:MAG TPA: hypothetical protein VF469_11095 [Kofleriaceae bacterium]
MTDELSHLIGLLRGQGIAIGVDDVTRIAAVLHHMRDWSRERRMRALKTLLAKSSDERKRFDHVAAVLLAPAAEAASLAPPLGTAEPPEPPEPHVVHVDRRRRWLLVAGGAVLVAALALYAIRRTPEPVQPIDAAAGTANPPSGASEVAPTVPSPPVATPPPIPESSSLPATLRGVAMGFGVASLLFAVWSLLAWRSDRRRHAAIEGLVRSSGRRTAGVHADCASLHPIDRRTVSSLAHMLVAPAPTELETALDPGATVEQTARNAGRLTLCYERDRHQPPLILVEDVSRSMERWPAHAEQIARAIEAQGQPVERRFMAGDPMQICDRRSLDGPSERIDDLTAHGRVVIVSDAAHFDQEPARMACRARALDGTIWLQPRPGELWRSGARWVNDRAFARTLGTVPGSLTSPTRVAPVWHPPRPRADADETADAWRSALGDDAYLALAATALLDLAVSWTTTLVWALISDGVIAPPWQQFERVWDLPEMTLLSGGRISLAPELRDRLIAAARGERPELLHRVAHWIDARLAAANEAAGDGSLGATVGDVYRDRIARAAGLDDSGSRVQRLVHRGLSSVVAAHLGDDERELCRVRDPHATLLAHLRRPLLVLALLSAIGSSVASMVAQAQHEVVPTHR